MSRAPAAGEESWLERNRNSESPRRDWRDEERPKPAEDDACVICGDDGIEIDMLGTCAECAPHGEETCDEWEARVEKRRKR